MPTDIFVPLAGMATGVILLLPLVRALVRHVERRAYRPSGELDALRDEVQALREGVSQLSESVERRLLDVEERVDFAERLLAQRKEDRRVGGGPVP